MADMQVTRGNRTVFVPQGASAKAINAAFRRAEEADARLAAQEKARVNKRDKARSEQVAREEGLEPVTITDPRTGEIYNRLIPSEETAGETAEKIREQRRAPEDTYSTKARRIRERAEAESAARREEIARVSQPFVPPTFEDPSLIQQVAGAVSTAYRGAVAAPLSLFPGLRAPMSDYVTGDKSFLGSMFPQIARGEEIIQEQLAKAPGVGGSAQRVVMGLAGALTDPSNVLPMAAASKALPSVVRGAGTRLGAGLGLTGGVAGLEAGVEAVREGGVARLPELAMGAVGALPAIPGARAFGAEFIEGKQTLARQRETLNTINKKRYAPGVEEKQRLGREFRGEEAPRTPEALAEDNIAYKPGEVVRETLDKETTSRKEIGIPHLKQGVEDMLKGIPVREEPTPQRIFKEPAVKPAADLTEGVQVPQSRKRINAEARATVSKGIQEVKVSKKAQKQAAADEALRVKDVEQRFAGLVDEPIVKPQEQQAFEKAEVELEASKTERLQRERVQEGLRPSRVVERAQVEETTRSIETIEEKLDGILTRAATLYDTQKAANVTGRVESPEMVATQRYIRHVRETADAIKRLKADPKKTAEMDTIKKGSPAHKGELSPEIQGRLVKVVKEAVALREKTDVLRDKELAELGGELDFLRNNPRGLETHLKMKETLRGERAKGDKSSLKGLSKEFSREEVGTIINTLYESPRLTSFETLRAVDGLLNIFDEDGVRVPQKSEIRLLKKAFGRDFVDALMDKRTRGQKIGDAAQNLSGIARAIVSSLDLSAPFRQGWLLSSSHPQKAVPAFLDMLKSFINAGHYTETMDAVKVSLKDTPWKQAGLDLTELGDVFASEEAFASEWVRSLKIGRFKPFEASERAYSVYLNKMRADSFKQVYDYLSSNKSVNAAEAKALAEWINTASGRGKLEVGGRSFEHWAPALNGILFSPKFAMSRLAVVNPLMYANLARQHPRIAKIAMADMAKNLSVGLSLLGMAKIAGWNVETNPMSTDFGRAKSDDGRHVIDFWGGAQPYARFYARVIGGLAGEETVSGGGKSSAKTAMETVTDFIRSRETPMVGAADKILSGKRDDPESDWTARDLYNQPYSLDQVAIQTVAPMFLRDVYQGIKDSGSDSLLPLTYTLFGGTAQVREPKE